MSKTTPVRAAGEVLTHRQTLTVMVGLMLGMFLSSLDQTIVSTSIYTIANDLDGLSLQAGATPAYLITSTVSTPLYGKLSDIFGRRPLYLTAILIFLVGSLYAGSVHSMTELAVARGIQGNCEFGHRVDRAGVQRAHQEDEDRRQVQRAAAEDVAQFAVQRGADRGRDQVRGGGPRLQGEPVQVVGNGVDGGGDD